MCGWLSGCLDCRDNRVVFLFWRDIVRKSRASLGEHENLARLAAVSVHSALAKLVYEAHRVSALSGRRRE